MLKIFGGLFTRPSIFDKLVKSYNYISFEIIINNEKYHLPFSPQFNIKFLIIQIVKGRLMIKVKNPNQFNQ